MKSLKMAIVFTCFNRIEKTRCCLEHLLYQNGINNNISFQIYVCDDGSTDGTKEMLNEYSTKGLKIVVVSGSNLFWNKGMYMAMKKAFEDDYDYYLMINDDVEFNDNFINIMLESFKEAGESCGISGPTQDNKQTCTTYGGKIFKNKCFLDPCGTIKECNLANWNCFLIDRNVINKIGIIDPHYSHSYGDYDYSMLMQRNKYKIYLAKDYVGKCDRNTEKGSFKDKSLGRKERIRKFFSPKGMSFKSGIRYSVKNFDFLGLGGLITFLGAYCKNLFSVLFK